MTSTDYVPALLADGKRRADADRLDITFREADVEQLPFDDGSFDVVLSSFGDVRAESLARGSRDAACLQAWRTHRPCELDARRFCRPALRVVGRHVPPPASVTPPTRWGAEDHLEALFRAHATNVRVTPREFAFRYKSPQHWLQVFRDFYGPDTRRLLR